MTVYGEVGSNFFHTRLVFSEYFLVPKFNVRLTVVDID